MAFSIYDVTIPVFISALKQTSHFLEKAESYGKEKEIPESVFIQARLAPDMKPLTFQIQEMTNIARELPIDIGGTELTPFERNENSFEDLQATIAKTIEILQKVPSDCMDGKLDANVMLHVDGGHWPFTGRTYTLKYALPDFFFHVTTTYGLLRHLGAPIGKIDYLGDITNS